MKTSEEIQAQILELEEEIENYEFGSYPYDVVNAELQYLYAFNSNSVDSKRGTP